MMCFSNLLGFVASGVFYGLISSFLRVFLAPISVEMFKVPNFVENFIIFILIVLVSISIGMGKHVEEGQIMTMLKLITFILCVLNLVTIAFAFVQFSE